MSILRHRISKLFATSDESSADSASVTSTSFKCNQSPTSFGASIVVALALTQSLENLRLGMMGGQYNTDSQIANRATCGSDPSSPNRESANAGCQSTPATTSEDLPLKEESKVDASPRTLKKTASTTFQAFSNSLRSRTQSFYSTSSGSPPRSGTKTPDKPEESFETWSLSKSRIGRSPRSSLGDTFSNSKKEKPQSPNTQPTVASPKAASSSSPLWASIKKRAGNSPHFNKASVQGQIEIPSSPIPFVEPVAPSLDVEIPDHILSVSQHLQRRSTRRMQPDFSEPPPGGDGHSRIDGQTQSRLELCTPPIGRMSAKGASNLLSLQPLFQTTSIGRPPANKHDRPANNGPQHIRFLPLNTPLRIPLPPSPLEKILSPTSSSDSTTPKTFSSSEEQVTPVQLRSPIIRRGRSLHRGSNHIDNKHKYQESHLLFSVEDVYMGTRRSSKSPIIHQESMPTTPERPNIGSRSAVDRARAERNDRYLALLRKDEDTASDTETDPDLDLGLSPARNVEKSSHKSTAINLDNSSQDLGRSTGKFRFAVEAIERTPGTVYDQSDSSIRFAVEAIDRTSGTVIDQMAPSSTENLNPVSILLGGDLPYMVEAIERMPRVPSLVKKSPSLEVKAIESIKASSPGLPEGPSSGNANAVQSPRETLDDTGGISLAHIVQGIRESKRSSESTVAVDSDALLGVGQDRMQNKVERIRTPIPEKNDTITKALVLTSPSSSNYSTSTNESCALTTHDPLCYAPSPWPTVHCRTSPSPDRASSGDMAQSSSNADGKGDEKDTYLESQIDEFNRSPWSNLLFDNDKENAEPLPPTDTGLSKITLPASTFLRLSSSELQLRPREDHDSEIWHAASQRGHNKSASSDLDEVALRKFEHSPSNMERPFNAARLPAFGETLPQLTYSPPRGRKVPNKAKRPVRYRQTLTDTSGNVGKEYTYSQVVKGHKHVDELKRSLEMVGFLEPDVPNGKGVSWAKEDELIGYADPQTPISKRVGPDTLDDASAERHDVNFGVDESNKENEAFVWNPSLVQEALLAPYMKLKASIDTSDNSFSKLPGKPSQSSKSDENKPFEMTPSARKIFQSLFKVDVADSEVEGARYDIRVVSPWNSSEKKSVAKHLMNVVYDLEEESVKAGLDKADGDEGEESSVEAGLGEADGDESEESSVEAGLDGNGSGEVD
ncbi:MAG: hypothetical protein Q9195_008667 [Heterodermia aff. obscurata]